jgi:hypothetical protein
MKAQSADGVIHEFPDGTDPAVIDRAMKAYVTAHANPSNPNSSQVGEGRAPAGVLQRLWHGMLGSDVSPAGRIGMGIADPGVGAAQLGSRAPVSVDAPPPILWTDSQQPAQMMPDTKAVDAGVAQREQGYEQKRKEGGQLGTDWYRLLGSAIGTAPLAAIPGAGGSVPARVASGAVAGALGGASMPVASKDYWQEKAKQAGIGGALGAGLGAAGSVLAPPLGADARLLAQKGVKLTPGQALSAQGTERAMQSFPILRGYIQGSVGRSVADFNHAVVGQALEPIGATVPRWTKAGHDLMTLATDKLSAAYDRVLPHITLARQGVENEFANNPEVTQMVNELSVDHLKRLGAIVNNKVFSRFDQATGQMAGDVFKKVESYLSRRVDSFSNTNDAELGEALHTIAGALRGEVAKQNPQWAGELQNINHAYSMFARLRGAATRNASSGGTFTPADLLSAVRSSDTSAGRGMFARGDAALQAFGEAGQRVIGKSLPNYTDRMRVGELLIGALPGLAMVPGYAALRGAQRVPAIGRGIAGVAPAAGSSAVPKHIVRGKEEFNVPPPH